MFLNDRDLSISAEVAIFLLLRANEQFASAPGEYDVGIDLKKVTKLEERIRMAAKQTLDQAIFLSAVNYQAVRQYKNRGTFVLPRGFQRVAALGGSGYPHIGYVIRSKTAVIAAFRGTEGLFDVLTDFDWVQIPFPYVSGAGKTHRGFTELYDEIVRKDLMSCMEQLSPEQKLIVTGHSLGGALATLSALDLAVNSRGKRRPIVYTFASPKVGDPQFADVFDRTVRESIRVVNAFDIVPRFPMSSEGAPYKHVEKKLSIGFQSLNPLKTHQIMYYFQKLSKLDPAYAAKLRRDNPGLCPDASGTRGNGGGMSPS
jgi:triacylglycerol lipase